MVEVHWFVQLFNVNSHFFPLLNSYRGLTAVIEFAVSISKPCAVICSMVSNRYFMNLMREGVIKVKMKNNLKTNFPLNSSFTRYYFKFVISYFYVQNGLTDYAKTEKVQWWCKNWSKKLVFIKCMSVCRAGVEILDLFWPNIQHYVSTRTELMHEKGFWKKQPPLW